MSAEIAGLPLRRAGRAGRAKGPAAPEAVAETDVDQAYERICEAIMDHSLPPETRLVETKLCEIFSLGRTRVRPSEKISHSLVSTSRVSGGRLWSMIASQMRS